MRSAGIPCMLWGSEAPDAQPREAVEAAVAAGMAAFGRHKKVIDRDGSAMTAAMARELVVAVMCEVIVLRRDGSRSPETHVVAGIAIDHQEELESLSTDGELVGWAVEQLAEMRMRDRVSTWADRPWGRPWDGDASASRAAGTVTEIGLSRGMCYGTCPVYTVTLRRDKASTYVGEMYVDRLGPHDADFDAEGSGDLAHAIVWLGFDRFDRNYAVGWTDAATTTIWVARGRQRRAIQDYGGAGPQELHRIAALIDEAADEPRMATAAGAGGGRVTTR